MRREGLELALDDIQTFTEGTFAIADVQARLAAEHELIAPYVVGEQGEQAGYTSLSSPDAFESALDELLAHVPARHEAVEEYLARP